MNTNELRKKSVNELKDELHLTLKELFNLKMQKGMGQPPKAHVFKRVRRMIARIKTIIHETSQEKGS